MAECCDPITIPTNCVNECNQLVNSCCVINEAGLPCIIPPVVLTGVSVVINSKFITDRVISLLPNPFYGTITVSDSSGRIDTDTTITKITNNTVTLSKPALSTGVTDVTFTFTDQRQCDINASIDAKVCVLSSCPEWTALPPNASGGWVSNNIGSLGAEYSNIDKCTVKLRGSIGTVSYLTSQPTVGILPVGFRPTITYNRLYTVGILVNSSIFKVSIIEVEASMGLVTLIDTTLVDTDSVTVYLDGIFFEVSPN